MTGNTPVCHGLTDQGKPCCAGTTLAIAIHGHRFALFLSKQWHPREALGGILRGLPQDGVAGRFL
ncbi:MAG: hypothetical protein HYX69_04120 [Planctomycetia bacterium]|nr:hypothetical protein [Planctomycetia bacterium]